MELKPAENCLSRVELPFTIALSTAEQPLLKALIHSPSQASAASRRPTTTRLRQLQERISLRQAIPTMAKLRSHKKIRSLNLLVNFKRDTQEEDGYRQPASPILPSLPARISSGHTAAPPLQFTAVQRALHETSHDRRGSNQLVVGVLALWDLDPEEYVCRNDIIEGRGHPDVYPVSDPEYGPGETARRPSSWIVDLCLTPAIPTDRDEVRLWLIIT